jgi:4-amino-4-deoxy-L-arabinose transferase-like glycosyltransferase
MALVALWVFGLACIASSFTFEYEVEIKDHLAGLYLSEGFRYVAKLPQLPVGIMLQAALIQAGAQLWERQILSLTISSLSILLVYKTSCLVHDKRASSLIAMFAGLNPLVILYSPATSSEGLTLFLVLLFVYLHSTRRYVQASIAMFVSALTNYACWLLVPLILVEGLARSLRGEADVRTVLPYFAGAAGIFLWGAINFLMAGNPFNFIMRLKRITDSLYWRANVFSLQGFELLLPILYPLALTFPFSLTWLRRLKEHGTSLQTLFTCATALSIFIGAAIKNVFPWARYFVQVVPLIIMRGFPRKVGKIHVIMYFAVSVFVACDHVARSMRFIELNS